MISPSAQRAHGLDHPLQRALGGLVRREPAGLRQARRQQAGCTGNVAVDLLGDERDDRVCQRERLGQDMQQGLRGRLFARVKPRLDQLEVPVAQLAVDEVVEPERCVGEVVARDPPTHVRLRALQPGEDPAVLDRRGRDRGPGILAHAQQNEARRVPQLVHEREPLGDPVFAEAHVLRGGHRQQAPTDRVGAVGREVASLREHRRARAAVDQIERVDPGAKRLRHPPPVRRLDDRVHVDVVERDLPHELQAHHDHPRDP